VKTNSLKNWKGTLSVIGVDWGDSGKGRMIDDLAANANLVVRYAGGSNTGHTVENKHGKFALHIMPSGIFRKNNLCLIGRNVAVDLESLVEEMKSLDNAGISYKNLIIDEQASLTMPWHKMRDRLREKYRKNEIGTTGKGVGPTYADRTERVGLLVKDLKDKNFKKNLKDELKFQNEIYNLNLRFETIYKKYQKIARKIKKHIGQTKTILNKHKNRNILFEGAQGYFLDIDAGTYPFVTSSNPGVIGISRSFDFLPSEISEIVGITKSYLTRVGAGPMPTKIIGTIAKQIVDRGKEFGTTTGRKRDVGWLDIVLINVAKDANKLTSIAITKLDVLSGQKKLKICISYTLKGKAVEYQPHDSDFLSKVKPIYKEFEGWHEDISNIRKFSNLPYNARRFIKSIEKLTQLPVKYISVGPKRGEVIYV